MDKIIINIIPLVVAALKAVPGALDALDELASMIKAGASEDDLTKKSSELNVKLVNLIAETDPLPSDGTNGD